MSSLNLKIKFISVFDKFTSTFKESSKGKIEKHNLMKIMD